MPIVKPNHIELAHPAGINFDLIVDTATMAPSQTPPNWPETMQWTLLYTN